MEISITSTGNLDIEEIIKGITSVEELLLIDFPDDIGKILLNKRLVELLFKRILRIESQIERLNRGM